MKDSELVEVQILLFILQVARRIPPFNIYFMGRPLSFGIEVRYRKIWP